MDRTKNRGAMWGLLALVLAVGLMGSALAGGSAFAAKGGGGGHHGGTVLPTGTCSVTPNPVAQWALITINGSGFVPGNSYGYDINGWMGFVTADPITGSFSKLSQAPLLGTDTVTFSNGTTCTFQVF